MYLHTATIKLQIFNTDCVKTCLTALMEYSENTESHSDSQIMNIIKFLRLTCSHSIGSPTVALCPKNSLVFFPYSAQHLSVRIVYRLCDAVRSPARAAIGPRWWHQDGTPPQFHAEVHDHHNAVFPSKRTGNVGPIDLLHGSFGIQYLTLPEGCSVRSSDAECSLSAAAVQPRGGKRGRPRFVSAIMIITTVGTTGG